MPFGVGAIGRAFANRAERGLYAGRRVMFGNKVSKNGNNKSRRKWLPNVQNKRVYSEQLDSMVPLRITTGALRNIDKAGGLDAYVFKIKSTPEDSRKAEQLREKILDHRRLLKQRETEQVRQQAVTDRKQQETALRSARTRLLPRAAAIVDEQTPT